jgi:hypothetical protein
MIPIPFEVLHPEEALFMQCIFKAGLSIRSTSEGLLFACIPVKLKRRKTDKYKNVIRWIRTRPDTDI